MKHVRSQDGTPIAFDQVGAGPALILVNGALSDRQSGAALAGLLAPHFTVFTYDRRGRGDSGNTLPYAVEREVEDLQAVIQAAGGSAFVFGHSSGAGLALHAAARGLHIGKLALYEPPFIVDNTRPPLPKDYMENLNRFLAEGRRGDAAAYFMTEAVGMPAAMMPDMRKAPMWTSIEALAPTLPYDQAIMQEAQSDGPQPLRQWASIQTPALVMDGGASSEWARNAVQALVDVLPHGQRRTLEGQTHGADPEVLAPVLIEFLSQGPQHSQPGTGQYAPVNGLNLYYEIHGRGSPLVLLHGGLGTIRMFDPILPALAEAHQVIAVELQAHGHTADIDRPLSFEQMADDIAGLIEHLGLENAGVMGYSVGGGVALQTAIRHPQVVRKLVLVSTPGKSDGWYPESRAGMASVNAEAAKMWVGSPMHQAYASVAPHPEDWPVLAAKSGQLLSKDYDWSAGVAGLKMPVLIVAADADAVRTAHTVEFFELLGGGKADAGWDGSGRPNSQLAILPGMTHYDVLAYPALASIVTAFLDAPMPSRQEAQ